MSRKTRDDLRNAQQAVEWVEALKEPTPGQHAAFTDWLLESRRHVRDFLLASAFERELRGIDPQRRHNVDALLAEAQTDVVALGDADTFHRKPHRRSWLASRTGRFTALAASVSLLAIAALLTPLWDRDRAVLETGLGEQRSFKLPDGSLIHLNTRSRATLRYSGKAREVRLDEGEALFVVAQEAARPFRVVTGDALIQALGTQFNVYHRADGTRVSVVEGRVSVVGAATETPRTRTEAGAAGAPLGAGEEAEVENDGRVMRTSSPDLTTAVAWRQRRLVFRNDTLADVATEFNRYNSMQIRVEDEAVRTRRFTGVLDADRPEALLRILEEEKDLRIDRGVEESEVSHR